MLWSHTGDDDEKDDHVEWQYQLLKQRREYKNMEEANLWENVWKLVDVSLNAFGKTKWNNYAIP